MRLCTVPDPRNPCTHATSLADEAGQSIADRPRMAYEKAHDGLQENKRCTARRDVHDINEAYLLSWKAAADLFLDIPVQGDEDVTRIRAIRTTRRRSRSRTTSCGRAATAAATTARWGPTCRSTAATSSRRTNARQTVSERGNPASELGAARLAALPPTPFDPAAFALRPESQFDWTKPVTGETDIFSRELVRDGSAWRDPGSQSVRSGSKPWVLFGVIRSWPEFTAMFDQAGSPAAVTQDFFKTKMLVVAIQRKPRQRCARRPGLRVLGARHDRRPSCRRCESTTGTAAHRPGAAGYAAEPAVTSILSLSRNNNGSVTFLENGASVTTVRY